MGWRWCSAETLRTVKLMNLIKKKTTKKIIELLPVSQPSNKHVIIFLFSVWHFLGKLGPILKVYLGNLKKAVGVVIVVVIVVIIVFNTTTTTPTAFFRLQQQQQ